MDVGQLELGLPVDISLDAFDSTIYGKLSGELIYLSSDTLTGQGDDGSTTTYYRARVRVDREAKAADSKFADLELRPGMTATVDIRTAKRTVIQFIAKSILRAFSGALTQRQRVGRASKVVSGNVLRFLGGSRILPSRKHADDRTLCPAANRQ